MNLLSNGNDVLQYLAKQRELYSMTRRSHEFYKVLWEVACAIA